MDTQITFEIDPNTPILVEFDEPGVQKVARVTRLTEEQLQELTGKSQRALNSAMSVIYNMARGIRGAIKELPATDLPDHVQLEFGLTLSAEAGAYIAKSGVEAALKVTLAWDRPGEVLPIVPQMGK